MGKSEAFALEAHGSRAKAALEEHGATIARVCMALVGDVAGVERAMERVAREATTLTYDDKPILPRLLGLARAACAVQQSRLPLRTGPFRPSEHAVDRRASEERDREPSTARDPSSPQEPNVARAALAKLKPTEREAVVLHLVGGLDVAGVAEACGIDGGAAKSRIARGVAQLVQENKK